jgi:predicted DNA-binding protein
MASIQISTTISEELKARLERYVRAHGVTRGHLIEQALEHHLRALEDLPADAIVPATIVLSRESAERVRDLIERPPEPTEAMKRLFDDR